MRLLTANTGHGPGKGNGDDMTEITTTDFSKFGSRERHMAEELLRASRSQGFPENFDDDGITIMMNMHSGHVFFTNAEFQVAMMNGDTLETWHNCPICGHEGFAEDMTDNDHGEDGECLEFLQDIGIVERAAA